jgi:hypothetical protein
MTKQIQIKKRILFQITTIILVLAIVGLFVYSFYPFQQKSVEVNLLERSAQAQDFKKAIYQSISCQHNCPLIQLESQGQTGMFPEPGCVQLCINSLKEQGYQPNQFTEQELLTDNLIQDIEFTISACKAQSGIANGLTVEKSQKLYGCTSSGLNTLKDNYEYLK